MYNKIERMRYWTQKVLPLVYDDSLSYYEVLNKFRDKLNEVIDSTNEYGELYAIKIADPIQWNIAEQYQSYTIVTDTVGKGYISRQPVPAGVLLSNEEYWTPIFDLEALIDEIRENIAYNAGTRTTTEVALKENDLVWWNGNIYKVLYNIPAGTAFIDGTNVESYTVNKRFEDFISMFDDVREEIETEKNDRKTADTELNNNLNAETTNRENADNTLYEKITTEIGNRESADNELRDIIDSISKTPDYHTYNIGEKTILTKFEKTGSYQLSDSKVIDREYLSGTYTGFSIQSCEYIGQNMFLIGMSNTSYTDTLLVVVDKDFNVLNRYNMDLGHCNDIAYDKTRGKLFVASYETGTYANSIVVLNRNTFAIEYVIPFGTGVARVAYDELNDIVYLTRSSVTGYITEIMNPDSYDIIASYSTITLPDFVPNIVTQGGVVIDGNYYQVGCKWGWLDENDGTYLFNTKPDGTYGKMYAFPQMTGDEVEGVTYDEANLYMFAHNYVTENIHVYKYPMYNSSVPFNATLFSGYGLQLKDGDDLNQLIDGKYNKPQGATNVLNWPPNQNGGTIYQIGCGYNHTLQIACLNNGMIWTRNRMTNGKTGTWTRWFPLTGETMTGAQSFDLAGAYLSNGAKSIFGTIPTYMFLQPSIGNLTVAARSVTGSYLINYETLSTFNYSLTKTGNLCRLQISKKDGTVFNATNNTPVAVQMNGTL